MEDINFIVKDVCCVGDGDTGKTCLLFTFSDGKFLTDYIPTIYDKEIINIELDNQKYSVKLHDTAGQEDFVRLRQLAYNYADVFILCYSVSNKVSYDNIIKKWAPELSQHSHIPIVLVATKMDLRTNNNDEDFISTTQGERLRKKIGACAFLECSAKEYKNIPDVINTAIRATIVQPRRTKLCTCCCC